MFGRPSKVAGASERFGAWHLRAVGGGRSLPVSRNFEFHAESWWSLDLPDGIWGRPYGSVHVAGHRQRFGFCPEHPNVGAVRPTVEPPLTMTREATSKKIANSKLRWSSARTKSFENAALLPGGSALFYKSVARRSAPERRGPAVILDFDETGVTLKFQSQTSDVNR